MSTSRVSLESHTRTPPRSPDRIAVDLLQVARRCTLRPRAARHRSHRGLLHSTNSRGIVDGISLCGSPVEGVRAESMHCRQMRYQQGNGGPILSAEYRILRKTIFHLIAWPTVAVLPVLLPTLLPTHLRARRGEIGRGGGGVAARAAGGPGRAGQRGAHASAPRREGRPRRGRGPPGRARRQRTTDGRSPLHRSVRWSQVEAVQTHCLSPNYFLHRKRQNCAKT